VILHLCTDVLLELFPLFQGEGVGLRDDGNDVHYFAELLHYNNIDGAEGVSGGINEEEGAVDSSVLDMLVTHGGQLLSQVRRVLVLNVLDDWVPATLVVDLVAIPGRVDDVQSQPDTVFNDNMRNTLNLRRLPHRFVVLQATLRVDKVGSAGVKKYASRARMVIPARMMGA